jgi:hypothetical protein
MGTRVTYFYHHLGLGDHIICNGMVRYFLKIHDEISLFCHAHYKKNIDYMYRDEPKIKILPIYSENEINSFLMNTKEKYYKIGFEKLKQYENSNLTFDETFYDIAGLDFRVRFNDYFVLENKERELEAYSTLNKTNEEYIYVHDAPDRGFCIDSSKHRQDLKIIRNDINFNLFEMKKILNNATEIHTMQTGMLDLCNSLRLQKPKIYVHTYVRNYSNFLFSKGINETIFI